CSPAAGFFFFDPSQIDLLCSASARGDLRRVLLLLQAGADINGQNKFKRTALQVAMLGNTPLVEALLAAGANPDARDPLLNLTVTHDAAREGFVDTVRALIAHGADVNLADDRGNLPLHLAQREGHRLITYLHKSVKEKEKNILLKTLTSI
uniref:Cyclin-dependent kinase inhibitor 2C (p18, inhibits CDK4) n=1 Tax=Kryptolebias marmoratus TaxID=37003 RepID=A0A3Q3BJR9_KRYMA